MRLVFPLTHIYKTFGSEATMDITITQGLALPITGAAQQAIDPKPHASRRVALVGFDYHGLKPTMLVQAGDTVRLGQPLFTDKKNPGVNFTAPASGVVRAVHRGQQRLFQSLEIELDGSDDAHGGGNAVQFVQYSEQALSTLSPEQVRTNLLQSGLWTALRTRPFGKVPAPESTPAAIFVTAIDTHPLAADPAVVVAESPALFKQGLQVLTRLGVPVHVCTPQTGHWADLGQVAGVQHHTFTGPHPAGLVGTHMHFVLPASARRTLWHVGYQDVMAIGHLFTTGRLLVQRVVALAGPVVTQPRLLRVRLGAALDEVVAGQLHDGQGVRHRVISGSVFGGRTARGAANFLGRYHNQISCLAEGDVRQLLHYLRPGANKHSVTRAFLSALLPQRLLNFTTTTQGSERAMVPIGSYERVMPLDILPTQLLRALLVGDTEMAQKLGCLELEEEDLALCTYVCPGKYEYGPVLRDVLTRIEKEG